MNKIFKGGIVMNFPKIVTEKIAKEGRKKNWVAEQAKIKYKTFIDKMTFDRFEAFYMALRLAKVLNIDLNELRDQYYEEWKDE
jgi:hypothetical protein